MENKGLLEKIKYICLVAKSGVMTEEDKHILNEYSKEHSDYLRLGKLFGHSVSDYAIACFKWINTKESLDAYYQALEPLSEDWRKDIQELADSNVYLECADSSCKELLK